MTPDERFAVAIDRAVDALRDQLTPAELYRLNEVALAIRHDTITPRQKADVLPLLRRLGTWI